MERWPIGGYKRLWPLWTLSNRPLRKGAGVQILNTQWSWPALIFAVGFLVANLAHPILWLFDIYWIYCIYQIFVRSSHAAIRMHGSCDRATSTTYEKPAVPKCSALASEGWYPDPTGGPVKRYWNGQHWTDEIAAR